MKRSDEKRNNELHEFLTPYGLAEAMINLLPKRDKPFNYVLDPGANSHQGVFGEAIKKNMPNTAVVGVEILEVDKTEPSYYDVFYSGTDFLTPLGSDTGWYLHLLRSGRWVNDVIGNPPFTVNNRPTAEMFVKQSVNCLAAGGLAILLLRLNFLCSQERWFKNGKDGLFKLIPPKKVYVLPRRPSFYREDPRTAEYFLKKKTNAHDYAVFVFEAGWQGKPELDWLEWDY